MRDCRSWSETGRKTSSVVSRLQGNLTCALRSFKKQEHGNRLYKFLTCLAYSLEEHSNHDREGIKRTLTTKIDRDQKTLKETYLQLFHIRLSQGILSLYFLSIFAN